MQNKISVDQKICERKRDFRDIQRDVRVFLFDRISENRIVENAS